MLVPTSKDKNRDRELSRILRDKKDEIARDAKLKPKKEGLKSGISTAQ